MVGLGERDQRASGDAFELLDLIVAKRMRRGLTTVIDSTGLDAARRAGWRELGERHGVPVHAVIFDAPAKLVRERNRAREQPVPGKVVTAQLRDAAADAAGALAGEGFAGVHAAGPVALVPPALVGALDAAARQDADPMALEFGLQISRFGFPGHPATTAQTLAELARAAEETGFTSLWVMDHFVQIPQVGREWDDMLESYTTLGYLAAATERIRLGTLVTGHHLPQHRPPREARRDARRAVRRPRLVRHRRRLVRARAPALRLGVPAAGRALRAARGRARAAAADVGPRLAAVRGPHDQRARGDLLPAAAAGARPDHGRRRRRAAHAAGWSPATRTPAT